MTAAPARRSTPHVLVLAAMLVLILLVSPNAHADALTDKVRTLGTGSFDAIEQTVEGLAATGDPRVAPLLEALGNGDLQVRKADGQIFITATAAAGGMFRLVDPLTGAEAGEAARGTLDKIKVNNKLRRTIRGALGALTLMSSDPSARRTAAESLFKSSDAAAIDALDQALKSESDSEIRSALEQARAAAIIRGSAPEPDKIAAIAVLRARGDRDALALLAGLVPAEGAATGAVAVVAAEAVAAIEGDLALWAGAQNIWYGLSLGSVLLLAAIGLAITFGVMGVINMAHGEMVMIGAYVTFTVQEVIRVSLPTMIDYSLLVALPFAFLITGLIGAGIERGILRWLYGRPLETLLATWGLSLILQQAVRSVFGPSNRGVANPDWMSGAVQLGQLTITYNRLWIFVFSLTVFALLLMLLRRTFFGLQMRAVTQNRAMASSMGIRTPYVDCLTFALGSAIAGVAGVALSQVDNVSPNLGQGYIIDSFMVVVFGGVGNLWGTLVGALTLGIANKFLEPYAGAVLGKILVLVFIILFIQKRPRGLFALRGRTVEA